MADLSMDTLLEENPPQLLEAGDVVEGTVVTAHKNEVWIDLGAHGLGLIPRKELGRAHNLHEGEAVNACVVLPDAEYGFSVLSLKKVAKEKGWDTLQQLFESGEMFEVTPYDANRGGLLIETEGIRGFLPVSQLSAKHYPRVNNADKDQILQKLNELVQQTLRVGVLDIDRENNKLILSEKVAKREETKQQLEKLSVGDVVTGTVTGTVDFGIFVTVGGVEGLVHISEISWDRVSNPADYVEVGQEVEAKVIAIDGDKLSLSIKQLTEDPWLEQIKDYQVGDVVEGSITRVTPFGAFIQIAPAIEALVHISELGEDADPDDYFTVGETRKFRIIDIDTQVRKISLSMAEESTSQGSDSG
ncbi:30S ribosomal protein S1 [Candidatus Saccharibacteria bacterium QS_5_54_17]|nr:MAG: 30S ribosomal protein S1 [Candidatus Saccharibacteria bacterium QS_5_54_17]